MRACKSVFLGNKDGRISYKEWVDYYTDLAMSTPSDEYFVQMMESTWCVSEDEENAIFKDKVKQLIQMMRQRLMVISNSSQDEFVLRKIFKDFDTNNLYHTTIQMEATNESRHFFECENDLHD